MSVQDKQTNLTAEEAIKILQEDSCFHCWYETMNYTQCTSKYYCKVRTAMNIAVEALKQGDVLDKIKVEIEMMNSAAYMGEYNAGLRDALKVINKYRKSEGENEQI